MRHANMNRLTLCSLAAAGAAVMIAASAQAQPIYSSSAYAFKSTVSGYEVSPQAATSGSGPDNYNQHQREEDKELTSGKVDLDTDVLESRSQGGPDSASASAHTDDIEIHPINGYKFSSDAIKTEISSSSGNGTIAFPEIDDVKIQIGKGNNPEVTLPADADPNTSLSTIFTDAGYPGLLDGTGISGIFKEEGTDGQGNGFANALHIKLDDFTAGGALDQPLTGDLFFAHVEVDPFNGEIAGGGSNNGGGNSGGGNNSGGNSGGSNNGGGNSGGGNNGGGGATAVPAPSGLGTMLLFSLALGGIVATKRRRCKNNAPRVAA